MRENKPKVYRTKKTAKKVYKKESIVYQSGKGTMPKSETTYPGISKVYPSKTSKYKK